MRIKVILAVLTLFLFSQVTLSAEENLRFCAVGDVLLDRGVRNVIKNHGVNYPFLKTTKFINSFDFAFCNLECPISKRGHALGKAYVFRADPEFIEGLKFSGFNIYSLANNHSLDYGRRAFLDTKAILGKNNFFVVGAGKNQKEASRAIVIKRKGINIAFLAYVTMPLEGITYRADLPGPSQANIEEISKEIKLAKKISDVVIVSFHWGREFDPKASAKQREYAYRAIESGASLVIGHHPHVIQTIEKYKGAFIIYSLGNFIFDQHKKERKEGIIFCCNIYKTGIKDVRLVPIVIRNFQANFAAKDEFENIATRIKKLSENCRITLEHKDNTIQLR